MSIVFIVVGVIGIVIGIIANEYSRYVSVIKELERLYLISIGCILIGVIMVVWGILMWDVGLVSTTIKSSLILSPQSSLLCISS